VSSAVKVTRRAQREFLEILAYYDEISPLLGQQFEAAFENRARLMGVQPRMYPNKQGFRRARLSPFPYQIVYEYDSRESIVRILAIWAERKNPPDLFESLRNAE
jgi:plasmid stabilization system protein ParE